jgi:hypothetical protein
MTERVEVSEVEGVTLNAFLVGEDNNRDGVGVGLASSVWATKKEGFFRFARNSKEEKNERL